eukprot:m.120554 g.120554  ORF g.120554 m.120554 type:complete len:124 (+) comp23240_c0_seq1:316-687(+)
MNRIPQETAVWFDLLLPVQTKHSIAEKLSASVCLATQRRPVSETSPGNIKVCKRGIWDMMAQNDSLSMERAVRSSFTRRAQQAPNLVHSSTLHRRRDVGKTMLDSRWLVLSTISSKVFEETSA